MTSGPPGRGSIDDPAPHQLAHRALSVKYPNTVSGVARISMVRSSTCGRSMTESSGFLAAPRPRPRAASRLFQFGEYFQSGQRPFPHLFEYVRERTERLPIGPVEAPRLFGPAAHEARG